MTWVLLALVVVLAFYAGVLRFYNEQLYQALKQERDDHKSTLAERNVYF